MIFHLEIIKGFTLGQLILLVLSLFVVIFLAKFLTLRLKRFFKDKLSREQLNVFIKLTYYSVIVIYLITALKFIGADFSGLLVAGGIVGIIIGFASQRIVGNLISGIFLFVERPFKIGSEVSIEGISGIVVDIKIISTILRTYDGLFVRLPNEKVFTSNITNFVEYAVRRNDAIVKITFTENAEKAIRLVNEVIAEHRFALVEPKPEVYIDSFGDNAIDIRIRVWSPNTVWFEFRKEILKDIKEKFEHSGIEVPYARQIVWLGDRLNELKTQPPVAAE